MRHPVAYVNPDTCTGSVSRASSAIASSWSSFASTGLGRSGFAHDVMGINLKTLSMPVPDTTARKSANGSSGICGAGRAFLRGFAGAGAALAAMDGGVSGFAGTGAALAAMAGGVPGFAATTSAVVFALRSF